mgnify:CR=1 FL=1
MRPKNCAGVNLPVAEHIPLKQGLRLFRFFPYNREVAEHIPLKQGLRLAWAIALKIFDGVAEHIPLKQGLRRLYPALQPIWRSRRAYSIKTRIETGLTLLVKTPVVRRRRAYSIKTRIETQFSRRSFST